MTTLIAVGATPLLSYALRTSEKGTTPPPRTFAGVGVGQEASASDVSGSISPRYGGVALQSLHRGHPETHPYHMRSKPRRPTPRHHRRCRIQSVGVGRRRRTGGQPGRIFDLPTAPLRLSFPSPLFFSPPFLPSLSSFLSSSLPPSFLCARKFLVSDGPSSASDHGERGCRRRMT